MPLPTFGLPKPSTIPPGHRTLPPHVPYSRPAVLWPCPALCSLSLLEQQPEGRAGVHRKVSPWTPGSSLIRS